MSQEFMSQYFDAAIYKVCGVYGWSCGGIDALADQRLSELCGVGEQAEFTMFVISSFAPRSLARGLLQLTDREPFMKE